MGFVQLKNGDIFTNTGVFNGEYDFTSFTLDSYNSGDSYGARPGRTVDEGSAFVCFAAGTEIKTADGVCPIEDLSVGQLVLTIDGGLQPIRWIGRRKFDSIDLRLKPKLRPVRIRAGALGEGYPSRDLVVSPQHRVLVRNNLLQRMFCTTEALVAAKHLLELPGIEVAEDLAEVEYFHMMFDRHQIVWSNGAATESMYTGKVALDSLAPEQLAEIFAIFPDLRDLPGDCSHGNDTRFIPARLLIPGPQGRRLAYKLRKRHGKFAFAYSAG
ncbi:hemolysin [Paracoccus alkanivorans]|uniref:Hemolysin n=2 Tax=Paracoccus alkanivorans TaxID=2116655 RepID=A0A3M0M8H0_9RHOB|nr:hemolysin [Paracoccus alkanivorans]